MRQLLRFLAALVVAVSGLPAAAGAVDIKTISTPLGIKAWLVQDKSAPAVSLSFSFAGGTASDPEGQLGVTTLMATPSARGLFARAIAQSAPPNAVYTSSMAAVWAEQFVESGPASVFATRTPVRCRDSIHRTGRRCRWSFPTG